MRYAKREHKVVETKDIPAGMSCDICGLTSASDWRWKITSGEAIGNYCQIEIEAKIGDSWPEGDFRTTFVVDICPNCFVTKVKPAIESLGATFVEYDVEDGYPRKIL